MLSHETKSDIGRKALFTKYIKRKRTMNWRTRRHLCKTGGLSISGEPPNLVSFSGNLITSQVGEPFRCHLPYHSWLQNFGTLVHHCKKVLVGDLKPSRGQLGGDSSLSIRSTVNGRLGCSSLSQLVLTPYLLTQKSTGFQLLWKAVGT